MTSRRLATASFVLALLLAAVPPATAGKADDTLRWASDLEIKVMDRYYDTSREGLILAHHIWDTLLFRDPATGEYKPLLAKSFRWVNDLTLEFELREGIRFHNGEKLDADDVVFSVNFVINPEHKIHTSSDYNWMKGAEKLGDYKVRIHLAAPFAPAFEYLSGPLTIYPNEYYAKVGPKGMGVKPVGTGPYRVTRVEAGSAVHLEINKDYFADSPKGKPSIGKIVYRSIPDGSTRLAELHAGGLDWIWRVPVDDAQKLAAEGKFQTKVGEIMRIGYLGFDAANRTAKNHPFTKLKVRQAVAHAIDREAMARNLVKGESRVVHAACYPGQFGCTEEVARYAYDPAKAKALLAEAGYPQGFETDIYAYRDRPYAEAIIGYLRAAGIKANLVWNTYPVLRDKNHAGKTELYFMAWGSSSIWDVSAITSHFFRGEDADLARDPQVIAWLKAGDTSTNAAGRKENYANALQRIAEQAYWVPLFTYVMNYAYAKELDFTPSPDETPLFFRAKWK
jgi:peptide/nickel transport system substrate-binding protein